VLGGMLGQDTYVAVMKENEYPPGVDGKFWKTGRKSCDENV
jgi:hypothetical protein